MTRRSFHVFTDLHEARAYRHEHGTGGWIFQDEASGESTIFPPDMSPSDIMRHPLTLNKTGNLIGCA